MLEVADFSRTFIELQIDLKEDPLNLFMSNFRFFGDFNDADDQKKVKFSSIFLHLIP